MNISRYRLSYTDYLRDHIIIKVRRFNADGFPECNEDKSILFWFEVYHII